VAKKVRGRAPAVIWWIRKQLDLGLCPVFSILYTVSDSEQLNDLEMIAIANYRATGTDLLNHTDGGGGMRGFRLSKEHVEKMAQSRRGKPSWAKGIPKPPEVREKIRKSLLGRKMPEEQRQKLAVAMTGTSRGVGRKHSREHCEKLRRAALGKKRGPMSEQGRKNISAAKKGKRLGYKHSEGSKRKMSESRRGIPCALRGRILPEETKRKMSEARYRWWERARMSTTTDEAANESAN
jgi:hypothetical protein